MLWGIDKRIEDSVSIPVRIGEAPKECVARGTGEALNEMDKLENNSLNKRKAYI